MKTFLANFLRKDLELNNRWWHRLVSVVWIVLLMFIFFTEISNIFEKENWVDDGFLVNRLDERVFHLPNFLKENERFGRNKIEAQKDTYYKNFSVKREGIYCSQNITEHIDYVANVLNTKYFKGDKDLISKEEFVDYLNETETLCVSLVTFGGTTRGYYKVDNALGREVFLKNDLKIWKKTNIPDFRELFMFLVEFLALVLFSIFIYYKLLLYIIFGRKK